MCKFCNCTTEDLSNERLISASISIGNISDVLGLEVAIEKDSENNSLIRSEIYMIRGGDSVVEDRVRINYCPICGRKL